MYATIKTLSVLALAGSVLAVPVADSQIQRRGGWGEWKWGNRGGAAPSGAQPWTNWASTATVYVTADSPAPTPAPSSAPAPAAPSPAAAETTSAPAAGGQFYGKPSNGGGDWSSAAPSSAAPVASSAPAPPVTGGDSSWEGVVVKWRSAMGLSALSDDSQLTANAQKTADESVGGLKHQLNPGSMAQVLAPGDADNFEHVFVGGWLCELPNTPGLNGVCAEQSKGWAYEGQTGHAEILTSPSYSKIGCAYSSGTGVWSCDLA